MVLGRAISALASGIDSVIHSENPVFCVSSCLGWCLRHSLADVWFNAFFQGIAYNAATVSVAMIVIYIVFVVVYTPLYLCSYLLSGWGSFAMFISGIVLLLRWFARSTTFAGNSGSGVIYLARTDVFMMQGPTEVSKRSTAWNTSNGLLNKSKN